MHGQQNIKHVQFYSKSKFDKLVLHVGFITGKLGHCLRPLLLTFETPRLQ